MADVVIRAEGLGKRYLIGHHLDEPYTALRDVVQQSIKSFGRSALDLLRGRPIVAGDTIDEFWALKNVSFAIERGDVVGIIGRNGAGKSTLLKILSRITEPSAGRVAVTGKVASLLEVGTGFHPELSGRENVFLNGAVLGMTRREVRRKFDEIVAFAGVERFIDTPVKRYSSGMYVRLAFAVAAHLDSDILITDEVLAVGDIEFQKKCLGKMSQVAHDGRTVLFVSHNIGSVSALCQKAIRLEQGQIAAAGDVRSVTESYLESAAPASAAAWTPTAKSPSVAAVRLDEAALAHGDFRAEVDFASPFALQPPVVGLVVSTLAGVPVWGTNGRFHPWARNDICAAHGTAVCEARTLPLAPGTYRLSVWLGDWHQDYEAREDVLTFDFRMNATIPYRPPSSIIGKVDWPATWTMAPTCGSDVPKVARA